MPGNGTHANAAFKVYCLHTKENLAAATCSNVSRRNYSRSYFPGCILPCSYQFSSRTREKSFARLAYAYARYIPCPMVHTLRRWLSDSWWGGG